MKNITQFPYGEGEFKHIDLSYTHTPEAFRPKVIEAAIQNKYASMESLRMFLSAGTGP
jgi:hypothetical protein